MLDVVVTQVGPHMADPDGEWVFKAAILDGSQKHELSVSCPFSGRYSDTVKLVIAEAFRLGKEAR